MTDSTLFFAPGDRVTFSAPTRYHTGRLTRTVRGVHPDLDAISVRAHGCPNFYVRAAEIVALNGCPVNLTRCHDCGARLAPTLSGPFCDPCRDRVQGGAA